MAKKDGKQQTDGKSSGWVGVVTGKTAKIVAAMTIVGTVGSQLQHVVDGVKEIPKLVKSLIPGPGSESDIDCLTGQMQVKPVIARFKEWKTVEFQLQGQNRCPRSLQVYMAYKTQNETLRIEPTIDKISDQLDCRGTVNRDCWEANSLEAHKAIDWKLIPPKLRKMGEMKDPVTIEINWLVIDSNDSRQIGSGKRAVTVKDDQ